MIGSSVLILLGVAVIAAFIVHQWFPDVAETIVHFKGLILRVVLSVIGVSFILLFLSSGVWYLMLFGFVLAVIAVLEFIHEDFSLRSWIGF